MMPSDFCLQFLRVFEQFRAERYRDAVGKWTIGYGHKITQSDNLPDEITVEHAEALLRVDAGRALDLVLRQTAGISLLPREHEALASLVYNCGPKALDDTDSTLMRHLRSGDRRNAALEFRRWHYAGGKPLGGLLRRRIAEELWFLGGHPRSVIDIAAEGWDSLVGA